jgi:hypothetical protein
MSVAFGFKAIGRFDEKKSEMLFAVGADDVIVMFDTRFTAPV